MNTEAMAKAYIEDAEYSLSEAKSAHKAGIYHRSVRSAQECTELSLKAILRLIGVECSRQHDVSIILQEIAERKSLPNWFISALPEISLISKRLAEERGPAFYGEDYCHPHRYEHAKHDAYSPPKVPIHLITKFSYLRFKMV